MGRKIVFFTAGILLLAGIVFSSGAAADTNKTIILATTTSVQDSGLLGLLMDSFQKVSGYTVKAIAVGSGQAIKMGRDGEADILWAHSPEDEQKFVDDGYGIQRVIFMHNDFIILGPQNDPAKARDAESAVEAFKRIAFSRELFVSRADNSGTYKKEKQLWAMAGVSPGKNNYLETGQGMAQTLKITQEKQGYVLTDRAAYFSLRKNLDLKIVYQKDNLLINRYSLILVNPAKFPKVNSQGAKDLMNFMLSQEVKEAVENFGREKFGEQVFFWDYEIRE